jgi:hypothetical protein
MSPDVLPSPQCPHDVGRPDRTVGRCACCRCARMTWRQVTRLLPRSQCHPVAGALAFGTRPRLPAAIGVGEPRVRMLPGTVSPYT